MTQTLILTQEQKNTLNYYLQDNRYPEAYRFARDVLSANSGDESTIKWLDMASDINEGDPNNFWHNFVRYSTISSANDQGVTVSNDQFQSASDFLARGVLSGFVNNGVIPHIEDLIRQDVASAVNQLGLTPEGWAGTAVAFLPGIGFDLEFDG